MNRLYRRLESSLVLLRPIRFATVASTRCHLVEFSKKVEKFSVIWVSLILLLKL